MSNAQKSDNTNNTNNNENGIRSLKLGLGILIGLIVYAYGFQVTDVSLEELKSENRRESGIRVTRALAKPDLFAYEKEEFEVLAPVMVPCPAGGYTPPSVDESAPYMVITPTCGDPETEVTIEGFGFEPNSTGPINFIPPSGVTLQIGNVEIDSGGHFETTVELRDRPSDEVQSIKVTTRRNVPGTLHLSGNGRETIDRIIETVFMAFLATTLGTILAIPVSFFAARNLMENIKNPLLSAAFSLIGWPLGMALGVWVIDRINTLGQIMAADTLLNLGGVIIAPVIVWGIAYWAFPQAEEDIPGPALRAARIVGIFVAGLVTLFGIHLLSSLGLLVGDSLLESEILGSFGFLAYFTRTVGEVTQFLLYPAIALVGGGLIGSVSGNLGQLLYERTPKNIGKVFNFLFAALAGALWAIIIGAIANWLYQIDEVIVLGNGPFWKSLSTDTILWPTIADITSTMLWPAVGGAIIGILFAVKSLFSDTFTVGMGVYYLTRTVLNVTRSIEPLVMGIVAVIWVSIGPFAGVLALATHTIVALAKLYSEQIENINDEPIEAITAAGANRLQMIIYAVIPQIVPPYIAFTMYRWDINVRMSTIIGFVGGGGIGLLLSQNINQLHYRQASAQMLAIAVVVITLDYVSSVLRQRLI